MKTIQISDALWKRLKLLSVERGVSMREVVEEMGAAWERSTPQTVVEQLVHATALRGAARALESALPGPPVARELKVELEE